MFVSMIAPALAFGATTSQSTMAAELRSLIKQAIALLTQEVTALQAELVAETVAPNATSSVATSSSAGAINISLNVTSSTTSTIGVSGAASSTVSETFVPSGISVATVAQASKMPLAKIGTITIGASSAGPIQLAALKLTFSGNGYAAGSSTLLNTVVLKDPNAVDVTSSFGATKTEDASAGTVGWTFPIASAASVPVISPAGKLTLQIWVETDAIPPIAGTAESLSVAIQNQNDLTYYDGTDAEAFTVGPISLPSNAVPMTISSLSWGVGM